MLTFSIVPLFAWIMVYEITMKHVSGTDTSIYTDMLLSRCCEFKTGVMVLII